MLSRILGTFAIAGVVLTGCAITPAGEMYLVASQSTTTLCNDHGTATGAKLLAIEAELGARGTLQCTSYYGTKTYVGERTSSTVGKRVYGRSAASSSLVVDDKNCSDFSTPAEAQRFFLAAGGPLSDPHGLDRDGDGNACEWGKTLSSSAKRYKPKPVRATSYRSYTSSSRCYVGPRGGTYTITSSGRKNYGGC
ncbi:excalibur calcium-binding domain-containing protein [Sinirhodobacter populi]|uniref:Excalibur calcium-binding domain-containing protein n=1 Tax=Paenirhodobacter populi TaxID=2306993 RepID=A0A443K7T6_9RHOB|nr:excalibur calcium-binding domain-containing protein [Sinirhodobacter populi]RWR28847.1 excalibur calcium-binding domain-containing protein [Sinirhodobacter populi]